MTIEIERKKNESRRRQTERTHIEIKRDIIRKNTYVAYVTNWHGISFLNGKIVRSNCKSLDSFMKFISRKYILDLCEVTVVEE